MAFHIFHWSSEIIEHLAEHDVTPEEFAAAFDNPIEVLLSDSSGDPALKGYDSRGRLLFLVYRELTDVDFEPVTAYETEEY